MQAITVQSQSTGFWYGCSMSPPLLSRLLAPGLSLLACAVVYTIGPDEPQLRIGLALFTLIDNL
jgi:hypothetical protein